MIKCPNCGSTAQPKLNTPPSVYNMGKLVITTHKCGCGCVFYIEKMSNGIINGHWQVLPKEGAD